MSLLPRVLRPLVACASVALLTAPAILHAQTQTDPAHPRQRAPLTILQMNDVYSTVPVNGLGGLARVATIKRALAAEGRHPLLMIGGDFLSSSVASTVFRGEQMIAALNASGLDIATVGNHEFDFGVDTLLTRMREATFQWVSSNVIDRQTGRPIGGAAPYLIRREGPVTVGIIGLCLKSEGIPPSVTARVDIEDPATAVARTLPLLRRDGANVIVLLTHLEMVDDRALADRFPDVDVIVGGHEHFPITTVVGRTLISKTGMDARNVARIDLDVRPGHPVDRYFELMPVTAAIAEDPAAAAVVASWEARLSSAMTEVVGRTLVPLDATETRLRVGETNLGSFIADAARARTGAQLALINSGGIRGNRVYDAGDLTRRTLLEMHPFGNVLCTLDVTGAQLREALESGVSKLPNAAGQFPQVSGFSYRVSVSRPAGQRVTEVRIGSAPLDPTAHYTLAVPDFLVDGGDGYRVLTFARVAVDKQAGPSLTDAIARAVAASGALQPHTDGRIVIEP